MHERSEKIGDPLSFTMQDVKKTKTRLWRLCPNPYAAGFSKSN
jgi:hypothetical protein